MEPVILFMLVAVALAAGLIAVVVVSQKNARNTRARTKGSPKAVSRTPSASMRASVPVQAWPLREGEKRAGAETPTSRENVHEGEGEDEAEREPLRLAS